MDHAEIYLLLGFRPFTAATFAGSKVYQLHNHSIGETWILAAGTMPSSSAISNQTLSNEVFNSPSEISSDVVALDRDITLAKISSSK